MHLLLLSGIGKPYDPATGEGVVGKNYAYQITSSVDVFFDDKIINPFIGAGALGMVIDEFNGDNFDHSGLGFIGGGYIAGWNTNGRPIETHPTPKGTPKWGAQMEAARWPRIISSRCTIATHGAVMSHRNNALDLDPTYRDVYGRPLMRMTFDFTDNEHKMSDYLTDRAAEIAKAMKPREFNAKNREGHYSIVPYQTTHNTGGAIMGADPKIERRQPLSAELGRAQPVRDGRLRLSAERRLQPDRHGRRADLLGGRRDQDAVPEEPRPAGAGLKDRRAMRTAAVIAPG